MMMMMIYTLRRPTFLLYNPLPLTSFASFHVTCPITQSHLHRPNRINGCHVFFHHCVFVINDNKNSLTMIKHTAGRTFVVQDCLRCSLCVLYCFVLCGYHTAGRTSHSRLIVAAAGMWHTGRTQAPQSAGLLQVSGTWQTSYRMHIVVVMCCGRLLVSSQVSIAHFLVLLTYYHVTSH